MPATREILWNVPLWARALMYGLFVIAAAILARGVWLRVSVWRRGRRGGAGRSLSQALAAVARDVIAQVAIWRSPAAGLSHLCIFWGFAVLFAGTCIVAVEDYGAAIAGVEHLFFTGTFYLAVSCALEVFGILFLGGLVLAILRRRLERRMRPLSRPVDIAILWLFLAIGVTGFLIEGLRIAGAHGGIAENGFERWSFAGWGLAHLFQGIPDATLRALHLALWLLHMALSMAFIAAIPYCKLRHILFAPLNIAASSPRPGGTLAGVSMEEVEETGRYGAGAVEDFTWRQLLSFDACTQCARCQNACPAHATGKPLSPMRVVLDIAAAGGHARKLHGETITAEVLWSCTTCAACVEECPVAIDQLAAIIDMRRSLVGEGEIRGSEQAALRSIGAAGNPWGLPQEERADWAKGLDVAVAAAGSDDELDVLLWVGCAGSYDRRGQKVSRALVRLLRAAGVRFAILGTRERCTGDPARRLGDEFTYHELAAGNVETLGSVRFKRIVTACPHCFNTIRNEYPALGGDHEVIHHSQLLAELVESGRLELAGGDGGAEAIAYHDPCYLGRQNGVFDAPRRVVEAAGGAVVEPCDTREHGMCCGAGGGRMWMEEDPGKRVNLARWKQIEAVQPVRVAVSCPFCMTMLTDAAAAGDSAGAETGGAIEVEDIAEILVRRLDQRTAE